MKSVRILITALSVGLVLTATATGCTLPGVACTEEFVYGLTVNVDDVNGPVCDASVTISEGDYSEVLEALDCGQYVGAGERGGTYTIVVDAAGYEREELNDIAVEEDVCHVVNRNVDIVMTASE